MHTPRFCRSIGIPTRHFIFCYYYIHSRNRSIRLQIDNSMDLNDAPISRDEVYKL